MDPAANGSRTSAHRPVLGLLWYGHRPKALYSALLRGLRAGGCEPDPAQPGYNTEISELDADWDPTELAANATTLVAQEVQVILAGDSQAAHAARAATDTIPIVIVTNGAPTDEGLTESNITGFSNASKQWTRRRYHEFMTKAGSGALTVLLNPGSPSAMAQWAEVVAELGSEPPRVEVYKPGEVKSRLEEKIPDVPGSQARRVLVLSDPVTTDSIGRPDGITGWAQSRHFRVPVMVGVPEATNPSLQIFAFGPDRIDLMERGGQLACQILNNPGFGLPPIDSPHLPPA
jgi:hypothetical protein